MSKIQDFLDGYSSGLQAQLNTEINNKAIYQAARAQTYTITDTNTSGWPLSVQETIGQLLRYIFPSEEGDISNVPTMSTPGLASTPILPPAILGGTTTNPDYINVISILTGRDATDTTKEVYDKLKKNYRANYEISNINSSKDFGGQKWFDNFMSSASDHMTLENLKISDIDIDYFEEIFDDLNKKFKREFGNPRNSFVSDRYFTPLKVLYDAFIEAGPNYVQPTGAAGSTGATSSNTVPVTVPPVASQVVTPTPPPEPTPAPPPPGKLYNSIVFNVEKTNILVPIQNTFDLGELTIVKRDYTPPIPVSANPPPTDIGEFSNMAPTDVPPTAPSGKSSPSGYTIKGTSYRVDNRKPTQIVLHYTAGWQMTDKNQGTVNFLQSRENGRGLTYHFIIAVDGHIENLVDPKNVAYHGTDSNQNSIGISLAGLGTTFHSKNTLASADAQIDKLKSKTLYKLNEYHAELVDFDEKKSPYKSIKFSQEVSDAQLRSLSSLLKKLRQDFPGIPAWNGLTQDKFDLMFPSRGTSYKSDKPGLYSHCSITTQKADVLPTPRLIKFLKQVRF